MAPLYLAALLFSPLVIVSGVAALVGVPLIFLVLVCFLIHAIYRGECLEAIYMAWGVVMVGTLIAGATWDIDPDAFAWTMVVELVIGAALFGLGEPVCEETE